MLKFLLLLFCVFSIFFSTMIITAKNPIHSILYLILVFCSVTFILIILNVEFIAITFLIVYVGAIAVLFLFVVMMLNIKIIELDETFWRYAIVGLVISLIFFFQILFFTFDFSFFSNLSDYFFSVKNYFFQIKIFLIPTNFFAEKIGYGCFAATGATLITFLSFCEYHPLLSSPSEFYMISVGSNYLLNDFSHFSHISNTTLLGSYIYTYGFFIFLVVSLILLISMVGSIVLVLHQNVNIKRQFIFKQVLRGLNNSICLKK